MTQDNSSSTEFDWPCFCGGEHPEWEYHSEEGCADTGQAFSFVSGGRRFDPETADLYDDDT